MPNEEDHSFPIKKKVIKLNVNLRAICTREMYPCLLPCVIGPPAETFKNLVACCRLKNISKNLQFCLVAYIKN
jgi:hypothetical protein